VELKVYRTSNTNRPNNVSNSPCGVESSTLTLLLTPLPPFLIHRVELKVDCECSAD